jgi:Kef-type K+ transport system membrane component KefB
MLVGPQLADIVPFSSALQLIGQLGLYLLVIEAGFEIELRSLREVGGRAIGASVTGMLLGAAPLAFGISKALGLSTKEALAVGACLAPCSTGIALRLLKQHEATNTPIGQLIIATAFGEDVISLTLLSELRVIARRHAGGPSYLVPVAISVGYSVVIGSMAVWAMPHVLGRYLLPRVPLHLVEPLLLLLLFAMASGLVAACQAGGASPLLGAFLAGVSFCTLQSLQSVWRHQVKRTQAWLARLFFAATVAFQTPVRLFARRRVWARAACFYCATLAKLFAGVWAEPMSAPTIATLGTAMAALGEFSFITGTIAHNELQLMSAETYASVTLAVLFTIVVSPVCLGLSLAWVERRARAAVAAGPGRERALYYKLNIKCLARWGLVGDVLRVLTSHQVDVIDCRLDEIGHFALYEAFLRDMRMQAPPATPPEGGGAPPSTPDDVRTRIAELRLALLQVVAHDAVTAGSPDGTSDEVTSCAGAHTVNFSALRGVSIHRWFPSDAAPDDWDAADGEGTVTATALMREESSATATQAPLQPPPVLHTPTPTSFRPVRSTAGGPLVPAHTSLDAAMAAMSAHRAGGAAGPESPPPLHRTSDDDRRVIVTYNTDDVDSVNRLVARAHAEAERQHAEQAARSHGLFGIYRHHAARGLESLDAGANVESQLEGPLNLREALRRANARGTPASPPLPPSPPPPAPPSES